MSITDLRAFLDIMRSRKEVVDIHAEVDAHLEAPEIHRRVIAAGGPVLLFHNVKGRGYPLVTNLFGTAARTDAAFGDNGEAFVRAAANAPHELLPPTPKKLWQHKSFIGQALRIGLRKTASAPVLEVVDHNPDLTTLPALTTWEEDGGPFITLPLVYTEHPDTHVPNLGMYRLQIHSSSTTGLHMQIGKGGGFHLARAAEKQQPLPVNVFLGGPPAAILAAIAPLPENVPELLLASLLIGKRLPMGKHRASQLPFLAGAEFVLSGYSLPEERAPEGPFGDHYGYYSLTHDFPVFRCQKMFRRKDAIFPATVVGKPVQEDFHIGNYLQKLLSPIFPVVMPAVRDLWSYGETGYHSLAAAVVRERYKKEALASAFRILGEGQLSLTKILLLIDTPMDLEDFPAVLQHLLERVDFRSDVHVFANTSMDTLDYTGNTLNEGSKAAILGIGEPIRTLPKEFHGTPPSYVTDVQMFCPGALVVSGPSHKDDAKAASRIAKEEVFSDWPLVVLVDDAKAATADASAFLWTTFTRFAPSSDLHAKKVQLKNFHPAITPPLVIDARMKKNYPEELFCDEATAALVDKRWNEYFPKGI